jgi:pSer/pThr/pTyr-binding forkhead associated (FHA) protein
MSVQILLGAVIVLVILVLFLLIRVLRFRRLQAENEIELQALRDTPLPAPVESTVQTNGDKKAATEQAEGEEEKTIYGRLIVIDGLETAEIVLNEEAFIIGRRAESGCHYVINEPFISPRHCMITTHDLTSYTIRDLNTKNGTFVNGERIPRDRDVVVPIGSEVGITERIKLELWDPHTVVNMETRRAGQTDARTTTRAATSVGDALFQPLPGIRYAADDDESEIEDNYSPV